MNNIYSFFENELRVMSNRPKSEMLENIPPGTYILRYDASGDEYYFDKSIDFEFNDKLYGKTIAHSKRILNTFQQRSGVTGVLLTGEKGSGKTLLAKVLSMSCKEKNIPTIIVNSPFCGDEFNRFIQSISDECLIIFDEFEKVYKFDEQEKILTLLDGVLLTKKLFVFTVNDSSRISYFLLNRPGRLYYMIEYRGLDAEFIKEYCNDLLVNKKYIEQVCFLSKAIQNFNFDMLKALVEEMNRYGESPHEVMEILNVRPIDMDNGYKITEIQRSGKKLKDSEFSCVGEIGSPIITSEFRFTEKNENDWTDIEFSASDLKMTDKNLDKFVYEFSANGKKYIVTVGRVKRQKNIDVIDLFNMGNKNVT